MFKFLRKQPAIGTIEIVPVQEGDRTAYRPRIFMAILSTHPPRWVAVYPCKGGYFLGYEHGYYTLYSPVFDSPREAFGALMSAWDSHCRVASYIEKPDLPVRK